MIFLNNTVISNNWLFSACQRKRIIVRHGEEQGESLVEMMGNFFDLYEPAGKDEENAYNVEIDEDMTKDQVLQKVMDIVTEIGQQ